MRVNLPVAGDPSRLSSLQVAFLFRSTKHERGLNVWGVGFFIERNYPGGALVGDVRHPQQPVDPPDTELLEAVAHSSKAVGNYAGLSLFLRRE